MVHEVDVLVGGSVHDLLDKEAQQAWLLQLEDGDVYCIILTPPCGSWRRANSANNGGPRPCRNRAHLWGLPNIRRGAQRRAEAGNEFIHFSIRAIVQAQVARKRGFLVRCILEHAEDLGRMSRGEPAAIWQLPELRGVFGDPPCVSVAGHQCQVHGVDRAKPTRLYSDILSMMQFGHTGWPRFDSRGYYLGPLPKCCGHVHREKFIGRRAHGGFCTSPTAAYPGGMCLFLAIRIMDAWLDSISSTFGGGWLISLERHRERLL